MYNLPADGVNMCKSRNLLLQTETCQVCVTSKVNCRGMWGWDLVGFLHIIDKGTKYPGTYTISLARAVQVAHTATQ